MSGCTPVPEGAEVSPANLGLFLPRPLFTSASFYLGLFRGRVRTDGGERGIRTPDTAFGPYNDLANRRLQPLGHLSAGWNTASILTRNPRFDD